VPAVNSLLAFAALSFALIIVPGPSVMFVVSRAVAHGRRAALLTVFGNALGIAAQVTLVAVGLGVVVERSVLAFTLVKLVGAGYLIWLGIQAIRQRSSRSAAALDAVPVLRPRRSLVVDGFIVGVANPKSIVFFAAILPQYVAPEGASPGLQMMLLGAIFVAVALISDGMWGLAAGTARQWFVGSPGRLAKLGTAGGLTMVGLGVQLAISGRKD
jgi:threonine/homoserine/homoserine lactone efflux protein